MSMPTHRPDKGGIANVAFRVKCEDLGFGQEIFLCRDDEHSGWGIPLYTTAEMHPWYQTKSPVALNLPSSTAFTGSESAASTCFDYKYCIFESGVKKTFETSEQSESDVIRSLPLKLLAADDFYAVNDILGKPPQSSADIFIERVQEVEPASSSAAGLSASNLMLMSRSSQHSTGGKNHRRHDSSSKVSAHQRQPQVTLDSSDGVVVVSVFLPVHLHRSNDGKWSADWDYESLLSMSTHLRVTRVGYVKWRGWHGNTGVAGSPEAGVPMNEREKVEACLRPFNCVPVWCTPAQFGEMYNGFCKGVLWSILHNVTSVYRKEDLAEADMQSDAATGSYAGSSSSFDSSSQYSEYNNDDIAAGPVHGDGGKEAQLWSAYTAINRQFADVIVQCFHEGDIVWIHGFHLMLVPSYLTRRIPMAKIGLFTHTPFPSSEIFRTLWCREDLLRGMLNADQVGFHLFEYARHFLTCCRRLLGLNYGMVPDGYGGYTLAIDNNGRNVTITSIHAGIDPPILRQILTHSSTFQKYHAIQDQFRGKVVIAAIDRLESLKGIPLKFLGLERFLRCRPQWIGKVVLVQIGISAFERGDDYVKTKAQVVNMAESINRRWPGTVQFQECAESEMRLLQRLAFLRAADILIMVPVRDGLNLVPLEFAYAHHDADTEAGRSDGRKRGISIISEFSSSARIMRGSLQVNPWKIAEIANALDLALNMTDEERLRRIKLASEYVSRVTTQRWALATLLDLKAVYKSDDIAQYSGAGLGLGYRVLGMDAGFNSLDTGKVAKSYKNAHSRLILLDYGGTILHNENTNNIERYQVVHKLRETVAPTAKLTQMLQDLCNDPRNTVFVVSGKEKHSLTNVLGNVNNLGLVAEHGMFLSWPSNDSHKKRKWENEVEDMDRSWRSMAIAIMEVYTSRTHGSYIEETEMKVLWQYRDADPEFGDIQARELEDHLCNVLRSYSVDILLGGLQEGGYVEVRPKGVNKGLSALHIVKHMGKAKQKKFDFALALGDDHCDEPMLSAMRQIGRRTERTPLPTANTQVFDLIEVEPYITRDVDAFTCTVGKKPTAAANYLNDVEEVHELLESLLRMSTRDHRFFSSVDLRDMSGVDESGSAFLSSYGAEENMKYNVQTITSGITRSMNLGQGGGMGSKSLSMGNFAGIEEKKSRIVSTSLSQFLGAIHDDEEEEDDAVFF